MPRSDSKISVCVGCGKQKERTLGQKSKFFCSPDCKRKRKREFWRRDHPLDYSLLRCKMCEKDFLPNPLVRYKAKYCSVPCKDKAKAITFRNFLRRNPNISKEYHQRNNRRRKWGGNWWKVLQRDNFTCRICGHKGDELEIRKHKILVHHLDGEGETGNNNHALENLWTVCYDCHEGLHGISMLKVEGKWQLGGKIFARLGLVVPELELKN